MVCVRGPLLALHAYLCPGRQLALPFVPHRGNGRLCCLQLPMHRLRMGQPSHDDDGCMNSLAAASVSRADNIA